MTRPIIGILGNVQRAQSPNFVSIERNLTNTACVRAIDRNGGVPVILPVPVEDPALMDPALAVCDGLLIPGGCDVDPRYYGEPPHKDIGNIIPELDAFWFHAVEYAKEHRIPILGVCRGMQLLNVAFKGSLYQDLGERAETTNLHQQELRRETPVHKVLIEPGTHLHKILGVDSPSTNTMHHQAVKDPGKGLVVTAHSEDGVIEGIETPDGLIVAVQWHPEDLIDSVPVMNRLFKNLAECALEQRRARGQR